MDVEAIEVGELDEALDRVCVLLSFFSQEIPAFNSVLSGKIILSTESGEIPSRPAWRPAGRRA